MRPDRGEAAWILAGIVFIYYGHWVIGGAMVWYGIASMQ